MSFEKHDLPDGWEWKTLGSLCEKPQYGWTSKAAPDGSVRFLRTTDIAKSSVDWSTVPFCAETPDDMEKYRVRAGDIVISRAGSVGFSKLIRDPVPDAVFASYLIRFRLLDPALRDFIALYLTSPSYWRQVEAQAVGIGMSNINAKKLASIDVPVPPVGSRTALVTATAALLGDIASGVGEIDAAEALLDAFESAVADAAIRGELTGVEEQWPTRPLGEIIERLTSGSRDWKPYYGSGSGRFLLAQTVRPRRLRPEEAIPVDPPQDDPARKRSAVKEDDVLVTIVGAGTGTVARVTEDLPEHYVCQSVALIRPGEELDGAFLELYLSARAGGQASFADLMYGQGRPHLGFAEMKKIAIPAPDLPTQREAVKAFRARIDSVQEMRDALRRARMEAKELVDATLHSAFAGRLSVSNNHPTLEAKNAHAVPAEN